MIFFPMRTTFSLAIGDIVFILYANNIICQVYAKQMRKDNRPKTDGAFYICRFVCLGRYVVMRIGMSTIPSDSCPNEQTCHCHNFYRPESFASQVKRFQQELCHTDIIGVPVGAQYPKKITTQLCFNRARKGSNHANIARPSLRSLLQKIKVHQQGRER